MLGELGFYVTLLYGVAVQLLPVILLYKIYHLLKNHLENRPGGQKEESTNETHHPA